MTLDISPELLRRYIATWQKINAEIDTIHSLANLLTLLNHSCKEQIEVESHALANIFQLIDNSAIRICSNLDDFIGIAEARLALEKLEQTKNHHV